MLEYYKENREGARENKEALGPASSVEPAVIAELLVETALNNEDPVKELLALYRGERFTVMQEKFLLLEALKRVESKELNDSRELGELSPDLLRIIEHSGELFEELLGSCQKTNDSPVEWSHAQHLAALSNSWGELMIAELDYLMERQEWSETELLLLQHTCDLCAELPYFWDDEKLRSTIESEFQKGVTNRLWSILKGPNFETLFHRPESSESTKTIARVFHLTSILQDEDLQEARLSFVVTTFEICRVLAPDDFSIPEHDPDNGGDFELPNEDQEQYPAAKPEDTGTGWNILDPGDFGYEQAVFDELCQDRLEQSVTDWAEILKDSLVAARIPGRFAAFADDFAHILRHTSRGSDLSRDIFDALVFASESAVGQLLPTIIAQCLERDDAVVQLVSLADFHNRYVGAPVTDPRLLLASELRKLPRKSQSKIFKKAVSIINTHPELFDDSVEARASIEELRGEIKRPLG